MKKYQVFKIQTIKHARIENFLRKSKKELDKFFGIEVNMPKVFLLDSRQEINRYWGEKTEKWEVGWVKNNFIFILNPQKYTKESNHKNSAGFWKTIKHEHCHIYYKEIVGGNRPIWVNEGLAGYLSGQIEARPNIKEALEIVDLYNTKRNNTRKYKVGYFWVKFLIQRFGQKKFLQLLKLLKEKNTEKEFKGIFYKIYKIRFNKKELQKNIVIDFL